MKNQMKILALTMAGLATIVACNPSPRAAEAGRDLKAPVRTVDKTAEDHRQSPTKGSSTSNMNFDLARKVDEVGKRLSPQENQMRTALDDGEWQTVLDLAQSLEAQWTSEGLDELSHYSRYRAEAHIGLGHPQEAILLIDPDPRHSDTGANLTLALALAMTDQLDPTGARQVADLCTRFSDLGPGFVPTPVTRNQKIAVVRTARAIDADSSAQDKVALREAREALRLDPSQRLAGYVLGEVCNRLGLREESRTGFLLASTLPGTAGKRARDMVKSIDHKPAGPGPYTSPPSNGGN